MSKCPFCGKKIECLRIYYREVASYTVYLDRSEEILDRTFAGYEEVKPDGYPICPSCYEEIPIPIRDERDIVDFLKEKYVILRSDDPEIKAQKDDLIIFREKVYKIIERKSKSNLLVLKLVEDEIAADILRADLEDKKDV